MYNGEIIRELLEKKGVTPSEFLESLGINSKKNSIQKIIHANPTASRLEMMADYFGESIDIFFKRSDERFNVGISAGNSAQKLTEYYEQKIASLQQLVEFKDELLKEKDERLEVYKTLIKALQSNDKNP